MRLYHHLYYRLLLVCLFESSTRVRAESFRHRRLFEWLAGYEPRTLITDYASIDLDEREIEKQLILDEFQPAKAMYVEGGHAKPIALLTLPDADPLESPIPRGTLVYGNTESGNAVQGRLAEDIFWDTSGKDVYILVEYQANKDPSNYVGCQVGGLTVTKSANRQGCFAPSGSIQILDFRLGSPEYHYNYTYDVHQDNINGLTIQRMSTMAFTEMWNCTSCPYDDYAKFVEYYDEFDYGDKWVMAAWDGKKTNFANGNADFSNETRKSRAEGIVIGAKYMNVWMYVIRTMELALDRCEGNCEDAPHKGDKFTRVHNETVGAKCSDTHIQAWDQAVAYYVGSLEGDSGSGQGVLLFDLADRLCRLYGTCGVYGDLDNGVSYVNNFLIEEFTQGQTFISKRECAKARKLKERIAKAMSVPLVQATLFTAYERTRSFYFASEGGITEEQSAGSKVRGAAFAATVLPLVHHCSPHDAKIIYEHMKLSRDSTKEGGDEGDYPDFVNFGAVKSAFERNYKCMGITCSLIGGIKQGDDYVGFARPCIDQSDNVSIWMTVFACVGLFVVFPLFLVALYRYRTGVDKNYVEEEAPNNFANESKWYWRTGIDTVTGKPAVPNNDFPDDLDLHDEALD